MPLTVKYNGHRTPAWFDSFRDGATHTIAELTARGAYGHFGQRGKLVMTKHWRIDREKNIGGAEGITGKSNLQLQKNDVRNCPSTVACLLVPDEYFFGIDGPDSENRDAELTRVIRQGLNASLDSWVPETEAGGRGQRSATVKVLEVTGQFSALKPVFVSAQKPVR
jgi:hypothetical protein